MQVCDKYVINGFINRLKSWCSTDSGRQVDLLVRFQSKVSPEPVDANIKNRSVEQGHEELEQEPVQKQGRKQLPVDDPERAQKEQHRKGVEELGGDGREVVSEPKVASLCLPLPKVIDAYVDELRHQVSHGRCENGNG